MKHQMTWLEGVSFFPLRLNLHNQTASQCTACPGTCSYQGFMCKAHPKGVCVCSLRWAALPIPEACSAWAHSHTLTNQPGVQPTEEQLVRLLGESGQAANRRPCALLGSCCCTFACELRAATALLASWLALALLVICRRCTHVSECAVEQPMCA
jgi:hypothetical protein